MTLDEIEHQHFTRTPIRDLFKEIEAAFGSSAPESAERARAAYLLGTYYEQEDRQASIRYFREARDLAKRLDQTRLLADMLHYDATEAFQIGDLKQAHAFEQEALSLATSVGHMYRVCFCMYTLGVLALRFEMVEEAISYLQKALRISEDHQLLKLKARILSKLAELSLASGDLTAAQKAAERAVELSLELNSQSEWHGAVIRLATVELEQRRYAAASRLIEEVRKTLPPQIQHHWCVTHTIVGKIDEAQGRYDQAEAELRTALTLASDARVRSNVHGHLAALNLKRHKSKVALKEAKAALKDAEEAQDPMLRKDALRALHDVYKALENFKLAYTYLERYNVLVSEKDKSLMSSRMQYYALNNEYEQAKLRSQEEAEAAELLRLKLEFKERELAANVGHLLRQAEMLRQYRSDLNSLVRRSSASDPSLQAIRSRLSSFPEQELNWQEFEGQFSEVHPDFLHSLSAKYPSLTTMEQRVAAMIRMNLKSIDIAQLFCITERAVEFHRLNLRKKLQLAKTDSLPGILVTFG